MHYVSAPPSPAPHTTGSAAAALLHELLLLGLCSKDSQARARALHLLQAAVQQGWGPQVIERKQLAC
jgi:hypothetical protein